MAAEPIGAISGIKSEATSFMKAQDDDENKKEKNGGKYIAYASLPNFLNGSLHPGAQGSQTAFNA